jgi:formamidopyrimidine-DNA glycosylase
MPELPEVETVRRGVAALITGRRVVAVRVRQAALRWPVPEAALCADLVGDVILSVERRAKYLLLRSGAGTVLIHLGMSGRLRVIPESTPAGRHDHVDWVLESGVVLRFQDPRRFGAVLWSTGDPLDHPQLRHLGPEPLSSAFSASYLYEHTRKRRLAIKQWLLDGRQVVGIGNIYACEVLFLARLHPALPAGQLSRGSCVLLVQAIQQILHQAIKQGGTTLRDFQNVAGKPGYFAQSLRVYGRAGEPCLACGTPIERMRQGQRGSFYCPACQKRMV